MTGLRGFHPPTALTRRRFGQMLGLGTAIGVLPWRIEAQDGARTLVFALPGLAGNFEPHYWVGFGDTVHVLDTVARGLTHMDFADPLPQPALAEGWEISQDGLSYDFRIREGLSFHDGTPLDAAAVLRTFRRMIDEDDPSRPPNSAAIDNLGGSNVTGFSAPDAMTFRITLAQPDAAILGRLSRPDMVIVSPAALDAHGQEVGQNFVGAGPYRIVGVTPNERVVLEAFEGFYGGTPAIERVVMQVIPEAVAQMAALASGQLDVTNLIPHSNLDRIGGMPGIEVAQSSAFISLMLAFNCEAGPLADIRVRRAINRAIDREAIVREAFFGHAEAPGYISPAAEQGFSEDHLAHSEHDPDGARALLAEAGAEGVALSLISENTGFWPRLGQVVERSLRDVGLDVSVEYLDGGSFNGRLFDKTAHELAFLQRSAFFPDPDGRFSALLLSGTIAAEQMTAHTGLETQPELDERLAQANAQTDPEARGALYVELNRFIAEEILPYAALANTYLPVVVTEGLTGINANALGTYRTFLEDAAFA